MNTVLITGGSGRVGRLLVAGFLRDGWRVVFTATTTERVETLLAEFGHPSALHGYAVDLMAEGGPGFLTDRVRSDGLVVTCLINNARTIGNLRVGDEGITARSEFVGEFVMDVVVPYELSMGIARAPNSSLRTVVNIGSMYGSVAPNPGLYEHPGSQSPIQYGVAKAALHHLTRELAVRLAPMGVRVNCVAFGGVRGRADVDFELRYASLVPSRRMLDDADLYGPVAFLAGEASSGVTGHVLAADGGWTAW